MRARAYEANGLLMNSTLACSLILVSRVPWKMLLQPDMTTWRKALADVNGTNYFRETEALGVDSDDVSAAVTILPRTAAFGADSDDVSALVTIPPWNGGVWRQQ